MRDRRDVRRMSADVDDRVLDADEPRDLLLQRAVDRALTRHDATRRYRASPPFHRVLRRPRDVRVAGETEVVVVREVEHATAGDHRMAARDAFVHLKERAPDPLPIE